MSELKSLTLNGKRYDCFVDTVARENGSSSASSLSKNQINALDALFKSASYIEDVSAKYAAFCEAFGLDIPDVPDVPDEPSEDVVVPSVKKGSVGFENGKMKLSPYASRATLIPIGQYLKKGASYKFSLGSLANSYIYGVMIFKAEAAGLTFPHNDSTATTYYSGVTETLVDSGWLTTDYTYTPDSDNCILAVNFKRADGADQSGSDYAVIFENFVFEEIV